MKHHHQRFDFVSRALYLLATIVDLVEHPRSLKEHQFRIHVKRPIIVHDESDTAIHRTISLIINRTVRVPAVVRIVQIHPSILLKVGMHRNRAESGM